MRLFTLSCFLLLVETTLADLDPYASLGIKKVASVKEIKRAYKQLAKEWHPDKNESPNAAERFMEISKAYEVLSDPLKKERYDKFGTIDEGNQRQEYHGHPFGFDPFHGFGGFDSGNSFFSKHRIGMRQYSHSILEKSNTQPFILFAYSGYCRTCFALEPIWQAVVEDLEPLGYGIATVNAMFDANLLEKLRVSRLPTILVLIEGRSIHYRGDFSRISAKTLRVFARDVIPDSYLLKLSTYDKLKRFIDQAKPTNKASILILGGSPEPRLRYLLSSLRLGDVARFAYVYLGEGTPEIEQMREALSIKCTQCENVLIFNEFPEKGPVARLSTNKASELTKESLDSLVDNNKFLLLPRISSPSFFDGLCPQSSRSSRSLCVWLIALSTSDESVIESFRTFTSSHGKSLSKKNVGLSYISATDQSSFLRPLMDGRSTHVEDEARDILIVWRSEHSRGKVVWLEGIWPSKGSSSHAERKVIQAIDDVVEGRRKMEKNVVFGDLLDEHAPNLFVRFSRKVVRFTERAWFELSKEETYPVLSAIFTFLIILVLGFFLSYANQEQGRRMKNAGSFGSTRTASTDSAWHPEDPKTSTEGEQLRNENESGAQSHERRMKRAMAVMQPLMHELRAESYFGMVRLLKPGCRSIIVLVDEEHKEQLVEQFAHCVYPLRNNKTFSFGYLLVEKNLGWFRKLLEHTLPAGEEGVKQPGPSMYERLKSINPKQTVGTVLVLCGWKLYFCIYHPMHVATGKKHFLGFDDDGETEDELSDESEDGEESCPRRNIRPSVSNVLNGFPNWLDRLLEGSARRYYIPEWPDNLH